MSVSCLYTEDHVSLFVMTCYHCNLVYVIKTFYFIRFCSLTFLALSNRLKAGKYLFKMLQMMGMFRS